MPTLLLIQAQYDLIYVKSAIKPQPTNLSSCELWELLIFLWEETQFLSLYHSQAIGWKDTSKEPAMCSEDYLNKDCVEKPCFDAVMFVFHQSYW